MLMSDMRRKTFSGKRQGSIKGSLYVQNNVIYYSFFLVILEGNL